MLNRILFVWLIMLLLVVLGIRYSPTWSFGDVMQVVVPLAVGIFAVGTYQWWKRTHPLGMWFSLDPLVYDGSDVVARRLSKRLILPVGTHKLLLKISPTTEAIFGRVGVRFVNRVTYLGGRARDGRRYFLFRLRNGRLEVLWGWENAPKDAIRITKICDKESMEPEQSSNRILKDKEDRVGGRWGDYDPPYPRAVEDSLWIEVDVNAMKPWRGHIYFVGTIIRGHRPYIRRSVEVTSTASTPDTSKIPLSVVL